MATSYRAQRRTSRAGGFTVLKHSLREALLWGFVAHLCFNTWHEIIGPAGAWTYQYSLFGLVSFLIDWVLPSQWVPLLVGFLALVVLVILGFKFLPLIRGAWDRPLHLVITALIVFGLTLGLFELVYYGLTSGQFYFSPALVYNTIPPLLVATIIIAGRGSRVYFQETGARDVIDIEPDTDPD